MPSRRRGIWVAYLLLALVAGMVGLIMWSEIEGVSTEGKLAWKNREVFWLIAGCGLVIWVAFHLRMGRSASFSYSRADVLGSARPGLVARLSSLPAAFRITALGLVAVALARPQTYKEEELKVEGIDIMVILDLSKSMEEQDLRRDRLDAGQRTIRQFLRKRKGKGDRIGLVVFAREAMLQCPLTLDYRSLEWIVADLAIGDVPEMGTAIGDALGLALASLKRSEARSKVAILISDGDSNVARRMDPKEAKELASELGVIVFTVLMGQESSAAPGIAAGTRYSVNPELLKEIASDTGGLYFNAGDDEQLEASFEEIRRTLDKTERVVVGVTPDLELFDRLVVAALFMLAFELLLRTTRWRQFP